VKDKQVNHFFKPQYHSKSSGQHKFFITIWPYIRKIFVVIVQSCDLSVGL